LLQRIDKDIFPNLIITIFFNIAATLLSLFFQHLGFKEVNFVVIYILSVLLTSRYTKGYVYGIVASIIAIFPFNFFFTEPVYTFTVDDPTYIFTFIVILIAVIFTSALTNKLIFSKELASKSEKQAQTLYQITSSLAKPGGTMEVAKVSVRCLIDLLQCNVIFINP